MGVLFSFGLLLVSLFDILKIKNFTEEGRNRQKGSLLT